AETALAPVMEGVAQPVIARPPHRDSGGLAASARDRSDACLRAELVVISIGDELTGLSEHRGGDKSSDPWHGAEDLDVTVLGRLPLLPRRRAEFLQDRVEPPTAFPLVALDQSELLDHQ